MTGGDLELRPIGFIESALTALDEAPPQADEGAPGAWLVLEPAVAAALEGVGVGARIVVLTWLDRADRTVLTTHPRGDVRRPVQGVFATRAPDRPNPIGLHETTVLSVDGLRVRVDQIEAVDGTPVLDIKPVLARVGER
jgi:tRNA-Thr(GGU) m(6)t(6)A37 methyltransferase TsaA